MSVAPDHLTQHLSSMAPHRAVLRSVECRLMGAVELEPPVLDVGCGDGHFASIAYDSPIDVGVDRGTSDAAEAARRGAGVYRQVLVADATSLPFATARFATVVSNCVIEHIVDVDAALGEIARVLRIGGTFATTVPSEHFADYLLGSTVCRRVGLTGLGARYGRFFNRISHHHHVLPASEWAERLGAVGLELEEHGYYFSPRAHRAFDLAHYLGVPNLLARSLTGRWVPAPRLMRPYDRWFRRYYDEPLPQPTGAYLFLRCVKRG